MIRNTAATPAALNITADHLADIEWSECEGEHEAMNAHGATVIHIGPLQDRAKCAKWGEKYTPGREWCIFDEGHNIIARGHSKDLRAARREAIAEARRIVGTLPEVPTEATEQTAAHQGDEPTMGAPEREVEA